MENSIEKLVERLYANILSNNFNNIAYEVTEELIKLPNAFEAIKPIIMLIESNKNVDFGNPGPLVHFLENFDEKEYDKKLIESVQRNPTSHTLFMLNRIINSVGDNQKKAYLCLYDTVINSPDTSEYVRKVAQEFKSFHINEGVDNDDILLKLKNIVLTKPINGQKDLITIKNVLSLELSIKELLTGSKNLPFILMKGIPYGRAQGILKKLGELSEKLELKSENDN
jgi:hypothetical protein